MPSALPARCGACTTCCRAGGAEIVGGWPTEGYTFEQSAAVVDGRFVGLVIDQRTQGLLTEARLDAWVDQVRPLLVERLQAPPASTPVPA
jgi:hypothetical protein